jgi:tetratricopeptide (TPR) repeat protein
MIILKNLHTTASDEQLRASIEESKRGIAEMRRLNDIWSEQAAVLFGHQNKGAELEKANRLEAAAREYEAAVAYGRAAGQMTVNQYFYSIERLCIIYRKLRRYDDEIATIRAALAEYINPKDRERLADRLVKAQLLQAKAQQEK